MSRLLRSMRGAVAGIALAALAVSAAAAADMKG